MGVPTSAPVWVRLRPALEVRLMLHRILPFALVAIAISTVFGLLFVTQRMGLIHPSLDRFTKRPIDLPVVMEPEV
jgi:hypothetical protein